MHNCADRGRSFRLQANRTISQEKIEAVRFPQLTSRPYEIWGLFGCDNLWKTTERNEGAGMKKKMEEYESV